MKVVAETLLLSIVLFVDVVVGNLLPSTLDNVCPGEMVNLTCEIDGDLLQWSLPLPLGSPLVFSYVDTDSSLVGVHRTFSGDSLGAYTVTLDSIDINPTRLTSSLEVTIFNFLDGQSIKCTGNSITVQFYDPPNSPPNVHISQIVNNTLNSTVTILWDPPQINGGAAVDNYTVSITPAPPSGDSNSTLTVTQTDFTLFYNVEYIVEVVATSCVGSSVTPSTLTFTSVRCSEPTTTENGTFGSTSRAERSTVTFQCNAEFMPANERTATCMADMMWNPNLGTFACNPIPPPTTAPPTLCPPLHPPVNGRLVDYTPNTNSPVSTTVTFQCDDGLFPRGVMTTTCGASGQWDRNPADLVCRERPVNCSLPTEPRNGTILGYDNFNVTVVEGTVLTFQCDSGFLLNGTMTITCTNAGEWNTDPGGLECTVSPPPSPIGGIIGGIIGALVVVIIIVVVIILVVVFVTKRNKDDDSYKSPGSMEMTDTLQGEYSELRHGGPRNSSRKNDPPPPADSEGYNRITHKLDPAPLTYDEVVIGGEKKVDISAEGYSTMNNGQGVQRLPGYGQLNNVATVEPVVYADLGSHLKKPNQQCYIDQHQVTYSTVDMNATKRKAATLPASTSSESTNAAADKLLNLDQALVQLRSVQGNWQELARSLRVPETYIEQIEEACGQDPGSCMTEVIDNWMRSCSGQPTWRELADALKTMNQNHLARQLLQIYDTGRLPVELDMNEVPKDVYKHDNEPPPPVPTRSPTFTEEDNSPGMSKTLPPRPPKHGVDKPPSRPPKPAPRDEPIIPPRPPKPPRQ